MKKKPTCIYILVQYDEDHDEYNEPFISAYSTKELAELAFQKSLEHNTFHRMPEHYIKEVVVDRVIAYFKEVEERLDA